MFSQSTLWTFNNFAAPQVLQIISLPYFNPPYLPNITTTARMFFEF